MKKTTITSVLFLAFNFFQSPAIALESAQLAVGAGFTSGGDTLGTLYYTNGDSQKVKAGGFIHIYAGANIPLSESLFSRLAIGYHFDEATSAQGTATFSRLPLDFIVFANQEQLRYGAGLTLHMSPELDASDFGDPTIKFDDALGFVLEAGYNFSSNVWVDFRYVAIDYEVKSVGSTSITSPNSTDGNHAGIYVSTSF